MTEKLDERLRRETRPLHTAAERAGVMQLLLKGVLPMHAYAALLFNVQAIYAALEEALEHHGDDACIARIFHPPLQPPLQPHLQPHLQRSASLAADLHVLAEHQTFALEGATQKYVARLRKLNVEAPRCLVAHAYVRYLGDLNGGQALKRLVARQYGLAQDQGTAFYEFGSAEQVAAMRDNFRTGLAEMPLGAEEIEAVVAEACEAFRWHVELFEELHQRHIATANQRS